MRRSRTVDRLLLATLRPAWLLIQAYGVRTYLACPWVAINLSGAEGPSGHPLVTMVFRPDSPLRVGDRWLRIGGVDFQGLSRFEARRLTGSLTLVCEGQPFRVEVERGEERFEAVVEPIPYPRWWWPMAAYASLALAGTFLLLRAPHWHLSRRFFVACLLISSLPAADRPGDLAMTLVGVVALPLGLALNLWCALEWTEAALPLRPWQRLLPWALAVVVSGSQVAHQFLPAGPLPLKVVNANVAVCGIASLAALSRAYRRSGPLERRQLRWVVYGFYVALLPAVLFYAGLALGTLNWLVWFPVSSLFLPAIPLGIVVSVVGYHWLDIDRLISATVSYTVLGIALLGGAVALVPRLARAASESLGIDPEAGQIGLSLALAVLVVPAHRALRPWLDRRLFAERFVLTQAFERLRAELGASRGLEELATRAGEGFYALLRPESIAIYGRAGDAFTPLLLRGQAFPPAFEAGSMLVQVLEAKHAPLFARSKELGPFERAALETLGAEVVLPQLREKQLVAFICLGGKRSGDIYTASDLALLASVADRCAEVIARIDAETLVREAQAMQSALRRYVPGAVADRVLAGDALEPAEREVTVLFVDLRGYTGVAERLAAEDVFATLNEHTERVSRIVQESGGTIVEFNGDGMMAVFGAPEALAKKEQQAVEAARRIVDSMPAHLAVGVGAATGPAFVGSIRSTDRLIWSAVGSTTNLAARLQSMTRELSASIAIDETTRERAGYVCIDFAHHPDVAIRGRTGRFDVFVLPLR